VGRLASELERDALDRLCRALHDASANLRRAGETDLRYVGVLYETLPDNATGPDDDVDDSFGYPCLEDQVGKTQRGKRSELGRLEDDGVPAGQRRPEFPAGDVEREVPRDDEPDDAERLAEGHVDAACDRNRLAEVLVDRARVEVEDVRHHPDLPARIGDRLADVARLDARQLLAVLLDERRQPAQQ